MCPRIARARVCARDLARVLVCACVYSVWEPCALGSCLLCRDVEPAQPKICGTGKVQVPGFSLPPWTTQRE